MSDEHDSDEESTTKPARRGRPPKRKPGATKVQQLAAAKQRAAQAESTVNNKLTDGDNTAETLNSAQPGATADAHLQAPVERIQPPTDEELRRQQLAEQVERWERKRLEIAALAPMAEASLGPMVTTLLLVLEEVRGRPIMDIPLKASRISATGMPEMYDTTVGDAVKRSIAELAITTGVGQKLSSPYAPSIATGMGVLTAVSMDWVLERRRKSGNARKPPMATPAPTQPPTPQPTPPTTADPGAT